MPGCFPWNFSVPMCVSSTYALYVISSVKVPLWGELPTTRYEPNVLKEMSTFMFFKIYIEVLILLDNYMNAVDVVGRGDV